jgi:sugar/nucleoside kinase (ribokinase family)
MSEVLIVGSVALDTVETPFGRVGRALGGAATYAATAASFFTGVRMVGVVGEDFPEEHLDFLRSRGVDLRGLERVPGKTFHWSGRYVGDLSQAETLATDLNVFADFNPTLPEAYRDTEYVFLANIDPELQRNVLRQVRAPRWTACDTMNFWIAGKRAALLELLEQVHLVLLNDAEARQLTGESDLGRAAQQILQGGPQAVVIKKGAHGAALYTEQPGESFPRWFSVPSYPVPVVRDPTGAGDSFAGGLMGYLAATEDLSEPNLRRAVVYGSVLASFNIEDFSLNRQRTLTREEIEERYEGFRRITAF